VSGDLGHPGGPAGEIRVLIADDEALVRQTKSTQNTCGAYSEDTQIRFRLEITAAICAHDRPFSFTGQAGLGSQVA
jgi:hypothetical protein